MPGWVGTVLPPLKFQPAHAKEEKPIPVAITRYGTPAERDFDAAAEESVVWRDADELKTPHVSRFAKGFACRDCEDPGDPVLSGVAMEGNGLIDPARHRDDPVLLARLAAGFRYLTLDRWDPVTRTPFFILSREPVSSSGSPLIEGRTAAVREGNALFPKGRWIELLDGNRSLGYWLIDDDCSSCASDAHVDAYVPPWDDMLLKNPSARLLPPGEEPRGKAGLTKAGTPGIL